MIVSLCTGNAARSVMAGALLEELRPDLAVVTAGTHVVDGQIISRRTRAGLAAIGLTADEHRSTQLRPDDLPRADLVLAMAAEHVRWIRRTHPEAADRTLTVVELDRRLTPGDGDAPLRRRVRALDPEGIDPDPGDDVVDPAGGEEADYVACARTLERLMRSLAPRL